MTNSLAVVPKEQRDPEAQDVENLAVETLSDSDAITQENLASSLIQECERAQTDRKDWLDKQSTWYELRYGVRRPKTFPWPGASNIHLPMTDSVIRSWMAKVDRLLWGSTPLASVEGEGGEDVEKQRKVERQLDWLLRFRMSNPITGYSTKRAFTIGNSKVAEQGFTTYKIIYEMKTRTQKEVLNVMDLPDDLQVVVLMLRNEVPEGTQLPEDILAAVMQAGSPEAYAAEILAEEFDLDVEADKKKIAVILKDIAAGEDIVEFQYTETVYDAPLVLPIANRDLIVPPDTTHLQTARVVAHRMFVSMQMLEEKSRLGKYMNVDVLKDKVSEIYSDPKNAARRGRASISNAGRSSSSILNDEQDAQRSREGVRETVGDSDLREIWELHFWHRPEEDAALERWVMTVDYETNTVLRFTPLPYRHGMLPFVQVATEWNDERFHSPRGIPERLRDLQTETNVSLNQQIDRETILTAPWYSYLTGAGFSPSSLRWIPGQGVPLQRHDAIHFHAMPRNDRPGEAEGRRQELKAWAEQYAGAQDFGLRAQANQGGGKGGGRTATEISQISALSDVLFNMDAGILSEQYGEVFFQVWALWEQFGDDQVWVRAANQQPEKMSKRELVGRYNFRFAGKADTSNPLLRAQKAQDRLTQLLPFAGQPLKTTDGKMLMISAGDLVKDYLEIEDARTASRILHEMTPEEVMAFQQQQMQQAQAMAQAQGMGEVQGHAQKNGIQLGMGPQGGPQPGGPQGMVGAASNRMAGAA